jgi:cell division GTPase FtsZ
MKIGFIGVGQGGSNLAASFAGKYDVMAFNTSETDLEKLPIPKDLRVCVKLEGSNGGAGKDTRLGEKAFNENLPVIAQKIHAFHDRHDLIVVCSGFGGGTGTAGIFKVLNLLGEQKVDHSVIATFPEPSEGTNEKLNACAAVKMLQRANKLSPSFRSWMLVDNNDLKNRIRQEEAQEKQKTGWEDFYNKMNGYINRDFTTLDDYTRMASITAFDPQDLLNLLRLKGGLTFGSGFLTWDENDSEGVLTSQVLELMNSTIFLADPDLSQAKGAAVLIERPGNFDKDGQIIDRMYAKLKESIGAGMLCRGVYVNDKPFEKAAQIFGNKKAVRCFVVVAGRRFPKTFIDRFYTVAKDEAEALKAKQTPDDLDINIKEVRGLLTGAYQQEAAVGSEPAKLDLSIWADEDDEE